MAPPVHLASFDACFKAAAFVALLVPEELTLHSVLDLEVAKQCLEPLAQKLYGESFSRILGS